MTWRRLRVARGLRGFWPLRLVRCVGRQPPHHQPHQLACRQHHRPFVRVLPYSMHLPVIIGGLLRGCIRTVCAAPHREERKYRPSSYVSSATLCPDCRRFHVQPAYVATFTSS